MVVADSRQFPWIAKEFAAVMDPQTERFIHYFAHLDSVGILECRDPTLAAHQFMGMINEFSLWPWMMGRESISVTRKDVVEETVRMFLLYVPALPTSEARTWRRGVTWESLIRDVTRSYPARQ